MRKALNKFFKKNADDDGMYFKITPKNELIYKFSDSNKVIRVNYAGITDVFIEILEIIFDTSFSKSQYMLKYCILGKKNEYIIKFKKKIPVNSIINTYKKKDIEIHDEKLFKKACSLYLKFCIKNTNDKSCGWIYRNKAFEYLSLTMDSNTKMDDCLLMYPESLELQLPDDAQTYREVLISMIEVAPRNITYPLLAYTFLAFSFYFISDDIDAESLPLMNISGTGEDDYLTPNFMANIYSNMFYRTVSFIYSIDLRNSISIHSKQSVISRNLYRQNDCPIIVTSKRKTTSISSGIGCKIVDYIAEHDLRTFPVFITGNPIEHDRIISIHLEEINIDTAALDAIFKNFDVFPLLIRDFVEYLQKLSDKIDFDAYFTRALYNTFSIGKTNMNLLTSHALLNYGFQVLLKFCEDTKIFDKAQALEYSKTSNRVFKEMAFCTVLPRTMLKNNSVDVFIKYVMGIIQNDISVPYTKWERPLGNDLLLHLDYVDYWTHFKSISGKQLVSTLEKRDFERILSKLNLLRRRKNNSTFYMPATPPENIGPLREERKTLAIKKNVLFDIVAKDNTSTV